MIDIIKDTLIDVLKLIPFLFVAFLIIEILEHKVTKNSKYLMAKSGKVGPLLGGVLGMFPQCGFSAMATNLYVTRIISLGTLIAIYLSTSDEMLPILLSENAEMSTIFTILGIKLFVGVLCGFVIDIVLRKSKKQSKTNYNICDEDHCHCNDGIVKSSIKHTFNTLIFILLISFVLNLLLEYAGNEFLEKLFLKDSIFSPFISSLVGLIPNCGASVMLTELYINNAINLGSAIGGLLTGSGIAILILFKSNKNMKENLLILCLIYSIGVVSGIIIELIGMIL